MSAVGVGGRMDRPARDSHLHDSGVFANGWLRLLCSGERGIASGRCISALKLHREGGAPTANVVGRTAFGVEAMLQSGLRPLRHGEVTVPPVRAPCRVYNELPIHPADGPRAVENGVTEWYAPRLLPCLTLKTRTL
jgi:hypothetical protein